MVLSGRIFAMRSHLLSVAALALLSVFVVISSPCLAESEEAGVQNVPDPEATLPPVTDNTHPYAGTPDDSDAAASYEEAVGAEEVPQSEE
jgi:hypothetical protein